MSETPSSPLPGGTDPRPGGPVEEAATEQTEALQPGKKTWWGIWVPRLIVGTIVVAAVWFGSIWVFSSTTDFLLTILISVFVALAMLPGVERLARRGWRRGAAAGLVMLIGALIAIVFIAAMVNVVVGQVAAMWDRLPQYADQLSEWVNDTFDYDLDVQGFIDEIRTDEDKVNDILGDALGGVVGIAGTVLGAIFKALTIGLFVFYILADLPRLRAAINRRFPQRQQEYIDTIFTISIDKVGSWVYSRGVLAAFSAAFHLVVFLILGLPYALAMALWVGIVSQFVPTIGTYLAGVVPVLVALLEDPIDALWVLIAITVYQQIENYLISPRVTANTMELHPAVAFGSAIVGASLLGGFGALLALPFAAAVTALIQTYGDHYDLIQSGAVESPEEYEARMEAKTAEKLAKKDRRWWHRSTKPAAADSG